MTTTETLTEVAGQLDGLEGQLDEILGTAPRLFRWSGREYVVVGLAIAVVGVGAAALARRYTTKKLQREYDVVLEEQIEATKNYYAKLHKKEQYSSPASAADALGNGEEEELKPLSEDYKEILRNYNNPENEPINDPRTIVVEKAVVQNVFTDSIELDFDYEAEEKLRTAREPYIISEDEFMNNELEYTQSTLTYYVGDGVLADERDVAIEIVDQVVGEKNLKRFGHGSRNKRIVFVRNDKMKMEWEIAMADGKFAHEVLGFIEHADYTPKARKFRDVDE